MTTIAYDGKTLAFDSRITEDGHVCGHSDKGIVTKEFYGAIAGDFVSIPLLRKWVESGRDPKLQPKFKKGTQFLMVLIHRESRSITVYEDSLEPMTMDDKVFSIGSGSAFAYGAMHAGASAKQAVQAAAMYDGSTGGAVRVLTF